MTLPATAQEIYDLLVGDEAISDALGTYTLPGGGVLPSGTMTGGLEITITAVPGYGPQALLTFETLLRPTWRIYVIAWGALGGMQAVVERVIALLPGATASSITGDAPGEGIGVIDQTVITWMNPCAVIEA
jgi:hypothetical protein